MDEIERGEGRRWIVRIWRYLDYFLFLPLGTNFDALAVLEELREERQAFLEAAKEDLGRPLTIREVLGLASRDIPDTVRIIRDLYRVHGADSRWVYWIADGPMVFLIVPVLVMLAGYSVGGAGGLVFGLALALGLWVMLVERIRTVMRDFRRGLPYRLEDLDAKFTIPNILTAIRLLSLWFFPMLVRDHHHLRALAFFGAVASTDWADGFIARHYSLRSRLGTALDPSVDRILLVVAFLSLWSAHLLPATLALMLVAREAVTIALGLTLFRPRGGRDNDVEVHWMGKLGFALSAVSVCGVLAVPPGPHLLSTLSELGLVVAFGFSIVALMIYLTRAIRRT